MIGRTNAVVGGSAIPDPSTLREVDIQNYSGFTVRVMYSNVNHAEETSISDFDTAYLEVDINTALLIRAEYNGDHFSPIVTNSAAQGVYIEAYDVDNKDSFIIPVYYPGDDKDTAIIITI